jgi:hypothetical protein
MEYASAEAELLGSDYAQLCRAYGDRRAVRRALQAGMYFSDQLESPAEALLVARCVELGFCTPYLQVNIVNPANGLLLGRVDGLWPSAAVLRGLRFYDSKHGRQLYSRQLGDTGSIVIEFDGRLKYAADYATSLEQERQRQNSIGNLGYRFVRITWSDLMRPKQLRAILIAAGVPRQS